MIEPGKPEESPLIEAIGHSGPIKMPPKKKLSAQAVADLTEWVKMGAPWPEPAEHAGGKGSPAEAARQHWAFQPVRDPPLPAVKDRAWPATSVDRFILARLEAKGLSPSPPADRRTLIRRATFDLIGPAADARGDRRLRGRRRRPTPTRG